MNRLIVVLAVSLWGAGNLACASSDADLIHALTAAAQKNFSGVVLLAKNGNPILMRAWGDGIRVDTKFNLGSINKIFTQVAIGQLAAAGKLALADTIRKHL